MAKNKAERPFVKLYREIWRDTEFTDMDEAPQRMFMLLLSELNITLAGLLHIRLNSWSRLSRDSTPETVRANILALDERCFVVADFDTDELLVRSVMRNDTLWNPSPKWQKGILKLALKAESQRIRLVLADEIARCGHMFTNAESVDELAREAIEQLRKAGLETCSDTCIETGIEATADSRHQTADRQTGRRANAQTAHQQTSRPADAQTANRQTADGHTANGQTRIHPSETAVAVPDGRIELGTFRAHTRARENGEMR